MVNIMRGANEVAAHDSPTEKPHPSGRYIEFRTNFSYVDALLDTAPTEIRAALEKGTPASDARHSFRIMNSRATNAENPDGWWPLPQQLDVLRREGQDWWKECALKLERS